MHSCSIKGSLWVRKVFIPILKPFISNGTLLLAPLLYLLLRRFCIFDPTFILRLHFMGTFWAWINSKFFQHLTLHYITHIISCHSLTYSKFLSVFHDQCTIGDYATILHCSGICWDPGFLHADILFAVFHCHVSLYIRALLNSWLT